MKTINTGILGCLLCSLVLVASQTLTLSAIIRDQAPAYMTHKNFPAPWWSYNGWTDFPTDGNSGTANGTNGWAVSDFELPMWMYGYPNGSLSNGEFGLVGTVCTKDNLDTCGRLGADGTPQYQYLGRSPVGTVQSPDSFYDFFHTTNHTFPIPYNFTFTLVPNTARTYTFAEIDFFPIDGRGWNDEGWDGSGYHNFAFCCQLHSYFAYQGGEIFSFTGDDDMYVFLGGYLVIDLGGVHTALSATVTLDDLGYLNINTVYSFDMFYCERHTTASNIAVTTSLELQCPGQLVDWCGVCGGNGQECCTPADLASCNDDNVCTIDLCGIPSLTPCQHTEIPCVATNSCVTANCDPTLGCLMTPINCNDNNACTIDSCNAASGCVHATITCPTNSCYKGSCDTTTGCVTTPVVCGVSDKCTTYSCSNSTGCSSTVNTCNDNDLCTIDSCNATTGCSNIPKDCNDGNPCTTDLCVLATGQCTNTPITCPSPNICQSGGCVNGTCVYANLTCASESNCGVDTCPVISKCSTPQKSCATEGCVYINTSCATGNPCSVGYCNEATGGCNTTAVNPTGFCLACGANACTWDDPCNPQVCTADGMCQTTPYNCTAANACTTSKCVAANGVASCDITAISCASATPVDACTPITCDDTLGCINTTSICNDYNPCTVDTCVGPNNCTHTIPPAVCDDNSVCTIDSCNSSFSSLTQACQHTNITCTPPNACQSNAGCDPVNGCMYQPTVCPTPADFCSVVICDNTAGCVTTSKSCPVTDADCYIGICNNVTATCTQQQRPNFAIITSAKKGGKTCFFAYDQKAAVAAITAGAIAGIVIGAVAAAALIGFGGKAAYDYLARAQSPISGVHPNPLYTASSSTGTNPTYGQ
jgi:fibro-slime domain-containing protein